MLGNLQTDISELLDLVRDEASYCATLAARPDITAEPATEAEYARRIVSIRQLRERWDLL